MTDRFDQLGRDLASALRAFMNEPAPVPPPEPAPEPPPDEGWTEFGTPTYEFLPGGTAPPFGRWKSSGSPGDPFVIGAVRDGPRPIIECDDQPGLYTDGGGGTPPEVSHVAVVGLHFKGKGKTAAIKLHQPGEDWLFEDCVFEGFNKGVVVVPWHPDKPVRMKNVRFRRCVFIDSVGESHAQGVYASGVDGLVFEECVFDNIGMDDPDIFRHGIYLSADNTGVEIRRNIIARSSSHGIQNRSGGLVEDNLILQCAIGIAINHEAGEDFVEGGTVSTVRNNVILEGRHIGEGEPRAIGMWFDNIARCDVEGNIIAHAAVYNAGSAMRFEDDAATGVTVDSSDIVHRWGDDSDKPDSHYVDPHRGYGDNVPIGTFFEEIRKGYRHDLSAAVLNQYIREGFQPA